MFQKTRAKSISLLAVAGIGAAIAGGLGAESAEAALLVKQIKVSNALNDFVQISEVIATEFGTGNDLALTSAGATASATSTFEFAWATPQRAIDGAGPSNMPDIYHSSTVINNDYLLIDLADSSWLESITILGRADCCSNRDIYDLELFDEDGNSIFQAAQLDATGSDHAVTVQLPGGPPPTDVPEPIGAIGLLAIVGGAMSRKAKRLSVEG